MSFWIEGEHWLSAGTAARLFREVTGEPMSESTWRRLSQQGVLSGRGYRLSDDGKLTHKLTMLAYLRRRAEEVIARCDAELAAERAEMAKREGA